MWLEKADVRVIPHIHKAVSNSVEQLGYYHMILTLSSFHIFDFFFLGLKECWIRVGTSEKTRFIHIAWKKARSSHVINAHILTRCDVTSKIGTKTAAIKASPGSYLYNFGEQDNSSAAKSFDELRYLWYDILMTSFRCHKSVMLMLKFIWKNLEVLKFLEIREKKSEINKKTEKLNTFVIYIAEKLQNV